MPEMPESFEDFIGKLSELRESIDMETIQAIMEVVPPELVRDVVMIISDPRVQRGISQVQEAVTNVQDISFDLFDSLPTALNELRESVQSAMEGVQNVMDGVDPARLASLKSHAPAVAATLAKVAMARPEAAGVREKVGSFLTKFGGAAYDGQPGAATVAVALSTKALKASVAKSAPARAGSAIAMAMDMILPEPYVAATDAVIEAFAAASGIDPYYEYAAWQMDATNKTLLTGAVNRYAKAQGMDSLPAAERFAATGKMVKALERLFEGVSADWVANGATSRVTANATRNARTAMRAIEGMAAQATKPAAPEAPAKKAPVKKAPTTKPENKQTPPTTPKRGTPKRGGLA